MRNFSIYIILILLLSLYSCSSSRKAMRSAAPEGSIPSYAVEYLNKYGDLAVNEMKRTGIPASITLAQGMLESDYGRSTLARKGNNHFGIKCHNDWDGARIYHNDNRRGECFRAYPSVENSYRDHSDFLVNGSRYHDLFRLSNTDYRGWAHGLKKAGYATDPKYPALLIRKIEDYGLHAYDTGARGTVGLSQKPAALAGQGAQPNTPPVTVAGGPPAAQLEPQDNQPELSAERESEEPIKVISLARTRIMKNNNVEYIITEEGDTYQSLAEEFQLLSWEIGRYNDLPPGTPLKEGQVIYLQPKRSKAARGLSIHTVASGETMYSISQKYAVRLSSLYKMNIMNEGIECVPGQKVRIR
jgi:LysM repeat protein